MSTVLTDLSDALAKTVAASGNGVVRVEARSRIPASGVIWSKDGLVVTTHHVVEVEENIAVGLADGGKAAATLVGRDPTTDVAVLRIQGSGLEAAEWGDSSDLRVGHLVLALGRPGASVRATLGIVSALGDAWRTPAGGRIDRYVQTDVVMYPGFSGGALVDGSGHVVGINTSMLLRGNSMTVPSVTVRRVVETLLEHGRVRRGYLGVGAQPVRLPAATAQALGQETGLLISSIETGGPAEESGLVLGDILVKIGGEPVRRLEELLGFLSGERVGERVTVQVLRGGQPREQQVRVGERPAGG